MNKIISKKIMAPNVIEYIFDAPEIVKNAKAGQFIILRVDAKGERVPFTICDYDKTNGTLTILVQTVGNSTSKLAELNVGDSVNDLVGPLGNPTDLSFAKKILLIGGGIGAAVIFAQAVQLKNENKNVDVILGAKNGSLVMYEKEFRENTQNVFVMTDDGSYGEKGFVTNKLKDLLDKGENYDVVFAVGPLMMMKAVSDLTKQYGVKTIISMNSIMVDGIGMCGGCRLTVGGKTKYACVDGPEFDAHEIDFDEAVMRSRIFKEDPNCKLRANVERQKVKEQLPSERVKNFSEVSLGFDEETMLIEASRCLNCKTPLCVKGCPVNINIPAFINELRNNNPLQANDIIKKSSALPAVCGRVCPQESQCEKNCVRKNSGGPIAIGALERYAADYALKNGAAVKNIEKMKDIKVAVIGSGPSGLSCAGELANNGVKVTIYEAFHRAGGVLVYGIPEFRLPKEIVDKEIDKLKDLGVDIELNRVIGKTIFVEELLSNFDYVFIGSGAGLPVFMNIKGENLNDVYCANEVLTRVNLMKAYQKDSDTPIKRGKNVIIVGAGNVAMDTARTCLRLGAETVTIVYRRTKEDMPARSAEIHHAEEEGIKFVTLSNPIEILGTTKVEGIKCIKMQQTEPDASGRRKVVEIEGSEFTIDCDQVIMSLGTSPNPLIKNSIKGLQTSPNGTIVVDENMETSIPRLYAGGDTVTGSATVILAMGAGKKAAQSILKKISDK